MTEGFHIDPADRAEQALEAGGRIDLGAQHEGIDEHADQIIQRRLAAPRDGGADRDVAGARQPGQQHRQRGVHNHEQSRIMLMRQAIQRRVHTGVDLEVEGRSVIAGDGRTRPVGGQIQLVRQRGQGAPPVVDLLRQQRFRIVLDAERLALPQRVVGVLHLERSPFRLAAADAVEVGGHEVAGQRGHGETVTRDMVDHAHQHKIAVGQPNHPQPHRRGHGHIEPCGDGLGDQAEHLGLTRIDNRELRHRTRVRGSEHQLVTLTIELRIDRPQHLVPLHQIPQRRP